MFRKLLLMGVATAGCLFVFNTDTADANRWERRAVRGYNRATRQFSRDVRRAYQPRYHYGPRYAHPYYNNYYRGGYYGGYYQPQGVFVSPRGAYIGGPSGGIGIRY